MSFGAYMAIKADENAAYAQRMKDLVLALSQSQSQLMPYVQHRDDCFKAGHEALLRGESPECVCGLDTLLELLNRQTIV